MTTGFADGSPGAAAPRVRAPGWRDPRLALGLLLVAVSVALGSWVVRQAQATTPVWSARTTLTPGQVITADDLVVADVRLPTSELDRYATVADGLPADTVVARVVSEGELLPLTALSDVDTRDMRPVGITVDATLAAEVVAGRSVDLWSIPERSQGGDEPAAEPSLVAEQLVVQSVSEPDSGFGISGSLVVQLLVPSADLPQVLAATTSSQGVRLLPAPVGSD